MEYTGSLVGKYIIDSINYGICVNLTHLRFSKSFLASLIGVPVTYQHFETDYPSFYKDHVQDLLMDDTSEKFPFKFETPKGFEAVINGPSTDEKIPLFLDGNNLVVTQRNKIMYLNQLAGHILKNRNDLEIQSFRNGFYKVLPQGLVSDFDIDELERLICGAGSEFKIQDLKSNHRVVGDLVDRDGDLSDMDLPKYDFPEMEQRKILNWFWITVANMSDTEQTRLLSLVTGSTALPTCGFKDLSPNFTISLTGSYNQSPKYHPSLHLICIGNHSTFEKFETNMLESLYDKSEVGICLLDGNANQPKLETVSSNPQLETEIQNEENGSWIAMFYQRNVANGCTMV